MHEQLLLAASKLTTDALFERIKALALPSSRCGRPCPRRRHRRPSLRPERRTKPATSKAAREPAADRMDQTRKRRRSRRSRCGQPRFVRRSSPSRLRDSGSTSRYGQEAHGALRFLQDMLAREIPGGDIPRVVEHCVLATAADIRRKVMAETNAPRRAPRPSKEGSRGMSARVRRAVWKRDGSRCAFVGRHGRCTQTRFLELHHVRPYALGGPPTVENIQLRCRAHNVYESELVFGARKVRTATSRKSHCFRASRAVRERRCT